MIAALSTLDFHLSGAEKYRSMASRVMFNTIEIMARAWMDIRDSCNGKNVKTSLFVFADIFGGKQALVPSCP